MSQQSTPPTTPTTPTTPSATTPAPASTPTDPAVVPAGTEPTAPAEPKSLLDPASKPVEAPVEFTPVAATDIKLPDGVTVDEILMGDFLGIVNDQKLTPAERTQELVDLQIAAQQKASEAGSQAWAEMQTNWQTEVKNDKELGGTNLQPTLDGIAKLVETYGSPELVEVMNLTGAGNNIHVIRFVNKIAAKLNEGAPVSPGNPISAPQTAAERLYPSMAKK